MLTVLERLARVECTRKTPIVSLYIIVCRDMRIPHAELNHRPLMSLTFLRLEVGG